MGIYNNNYLKEPPQDVHWSRLHRFKHPDSIHLNGFDCRNRKVLRRSVKRLQLRPRLKLESNKIRKNDFQNSLFKFFFLMFGYLRKIKWIKICIFVLKNKIWQKKLYFLDHPLFKRVCKILHFIHFLFKSCQTKYHYFN